jgi:hypothetical protein
MIPASEILAIAYSSRHCTEYGCRKCAARARWHRRRQWRTRKKIAPYKTGRK